MKKVYVFILIIFCCLSATNKIMAQTVDSGPTGTCTWTLSGTSQNYTLTITPSNGVTGAMDDYDPNVFNMPWYSYRTQIKTLDIQQGVTRIGDFAFRQCNVTSVTIPNSVTFVGSGSFDGCQELISITIPDSVTFIGLRTFGDCYGLTSITLSSSLTTIGAIAFLNCTGLTEIHSKAIIPPSTGYACFGMVPTTLSLYVPCGTVSAYKSTSGDAYGPWSYFPNILEEIRYDVSLTSNDEKMGEARVMQYSCTNDTVIIEAFPNICYSFVKWGDGNTENPRIMEITSDTSVLAIFGSDITVTGSTEICYGMNTTLTASSTGSLTNPNYKWYSSDTATTPFYTGNIYTTSNLTSDTTFYVSVESDECRENENTGDRKEVTVILLDPNTQGKDFYVSFGNNFGQGSSVVTLQVRIVSQKATTVKLTFKDINRDTTFNIPANSVYTYNLNTVEKAAVYLTATGTSNKSLRIQSTEEISVYALNQYINTTDATFILPVDVLGTDYYQLSYNHVNDYEFYAVIATEDNTTIYENNASTVTLQSGEVYSLYTNADITGYHITSNKPVAYFVIRTCAPIPANITACDHLYEQMTPVSSWGKIFVIPVTKRGVERVRIVASQDGTIITQTGGVIKIDGGGKNSLNLDRGEFVEMEIYLDSGGCYISSDKPVGVASYLVGMNHPELKYGKGTVGDPALTVIPPIEQMVFSADIAPFIPSIGTALTEHYVMVITPTTTCNQTTVTIGNGSPTSLSGGSWIAGNGLGAAYSFYTMPLTSATDAYHFSNPNGLFVMGFGLGERETYYYLSGAAMRTLEASFTVDDNHYQTLNGQTICVGSAVNFRASGISPEAGVTGYLKWYIDEIEQTSQTDVLQWTGSLTNGEHTVRIDVTDKCRTYSFETTFEVINRAVASDITAKDTTICYNTTANLTISAPNVTNSNYKWYSSQTATTPFHTEASYTTSHLTADTTFYVSVSGDNYCENDTGKRKAVTVSVYAPLEAGFISPTESRHCYRVSTLNIDLGTYPLSGGSGNYFYQWESSTDGTQWSNLGIPTQTYNISGLTETKYYRRAVVDAVCGTVYSDIDTVYYVRAIPYFLTEICPGLTVRISPSTNGLWESSDPSIMEVVNNNSIVGINPGAAKLTFYDSLAGGCNTPIDIKVNAYPVPDEITGSAKVCIGKTIELSNTTSGGRWTKNNDNISFDNPQANPVKVTGETKGNSFVTYTVSNFGCQTKRTFRLKVIPDSPPSKIIIGIER